MSEEQNLINAIEANSRDFFLNATTKVETANPIDAVWCW